MSPAEENAGAGSVFERQAAEAKEAKEAMRVEADRRLAAMPKASAKMQDNQPANATGRNADGTFAPKENTEAAPAAKQDRAKPVPSEAKDIDRAFLSDFDEEFRATFEKLSPSSQEKALKVLTAEGRKEKDYRQKTMSIADREKALAAEEETLRFGRTVLRDPEMFGAVRSVHDKRTGKAVEAKPEAPFDHITATPEEFAEHERQLRKTAADEAYARFKADLDAKEQAQSEKVQMALAAKAAFYDTGDYDPETVNAVYDKLTSRGVKFTKDNVVEILKEWLPPPTKAAKIEPPKDTLIPAASSGKVSSGAPVLARAGGVTPLVTTPAFIQSGKKPSDVNERLQEAVFQVNARRAAAGRDLISLGSNGAARA